MQGNNLPTILYFKPHGACGMQINGKAAKSRQAASYDAEMINIMITSQLHDPELDECLLFIRAFYLITLSSLGCLENVF